MRPLEISEVEALLEHIKGRDVEILIRTALMTGIRVGEMIGLTWDRIDFEKGQILIDRQICRGEHNALSYSPTKSGKTRTIAPAPQIMQDLRNWKKKQTELRLAKGSAWDSEAFPDLVFTFNGKPISHTAPERWLKKALNEIGLSDHRWHDLRHTYAVLSIMAGDDVKTIQHNLGHHSAAFTLDRYGHYTETMGKVSSERLGAFYSKMLKI